MSVAALVLFFHLLRLFQLGANDDIFQQSLEVKGSHRVSVVWKMKRGEGDARVLTL